MPVEHFHESWNETLESVSVISINDALIVPWREGTRQKYNDVSDIRYEANCDFSFPDWIKVLAGAEIFYYFFSRALVFEI